MPRYNVRRPKDGLWACFSTVPDDYITPWMTKAAYEGWRRDQYGEQCGPVGQANLMSYKEAEKRRKQRREWEQTL